MNTQLGELVVTEKLRMAAWTKKNGPGPTAAALQS